MTVSYAVQESLVLGQLLKKFNLLLQRHVMENNLALKSKKPLKADIAINITGPELASAIGALRDYITLRIANIVDSHHAALSLKNFVGIDSNKLKKLKEIPEIKKILSSRNNWIGHINPRFIGPVENQILYSEKIVSILNELQIVANMK
jgi:hypothetical protein